MQSSGDNDGPPDFLPFRAVAEHTRGVLADLAPAEESMVDELVAERRREAAHEDSE